MSAPPMTAALALELWGRLIGECERMAARPSLNVDELLKACKRVGEAPVPSGALSRVNPFIVLLDTAKAFALEAMIGRAAKVPELLAAIAAADAERKLERPERGSAPEPEPPARPFRADIDG